MENVSPSRKAAALGIRGREVGAPLTPLAHYASLLVSRGEAGRGKSIPKPIMSWRPRPNSLIHKRV